MLIGAGQLIKQRSLSTILISCQSESKKCSLRYRMLCCFFMIFTGFTQTGMIHQLLCYFLLIHDRIRAGFPHVFNLNLLCISHSQGQFIPLYHKFHRITHGRILDKFYRFVGNYTHIKEMLSQCAFTSDGCNCRFFSDW